MQFIFIAVVVLMIFFALKGWVEDHLPLVIAVGLFLVSWYFLGLLRTVILTVALVAIVCVIQTRRCRLPMVFHLPPWPAIWGMQILPPPQRSTPTRSKAQQRLRQT